jgi:hypothetical protein
MTYRRLKDVGQQIEEMHSMANQLAPYTYPQTSRFKEFEVDVLKQRQMTLDGYEIMAHFSRADYGKCKIESVEIIGVYTPFLPMYVLCKIATKFLGGHELKYSESFKKGRKVYIWAVALDERGRPIPLTDPELERGMYEDFGYSYVASELLG